MLAQAALRGVRALSSAFDLVAGGAVLAPAGFTRASTATLWDGAAFNAYAVDVPRFTASGALVIEPAATNVLPASEALDDAAWNTTRASITANATPAPDGTTTADRMVEDTSTGNHILNQSVSFSSGTAYTFSLCMRADERDSVLVLLPNAAFPVNASAIFDVSAPGVTISGGADDGGIETMAGGWHRLWVSATADTAASGFPTVYLFNGGASYTGDGTSGLFLWGMQIEAGARATSYVPTAAAAVTRAGDLLTWTPDTAHTVTLIGTAANGTVHTGAAPLIQAAPALTPWTAPAGRWSAISAAPA
jgi:hypothetical protein